MWPPPSVAPGADAPADNDAQADHTDAQGNEDTAQDAEPWEDWPVQAKLAMVLDYVRQTYHYCLFCGCQVCNSQETASHMQVMVQAVQHVPERHISHVTDILNQSVSALIDM